jgi:RNA recognition motif-containing protein
LYVGNLPWTATEDDLRSAFETCGSVLSARIITERETGRSRGFGFVEVEDSDGNDLIQKMNGYVLGGRPLTVNEARQREQVLARPVGA